MNPINGILNSPVRKADFLCRHTPLVCEREHTVFLTGRRTRGFLLGVDMPSGVYERTIKRTIKFYKVCSKCNQKKARSSFYLVKKDKHYRRVYCKICWNVMTSEYSRAHSRNPRKTIKYINRRYELNPWLKTLHSIKNRCSSKKHPYYKKGRRNHLTADNLKQLWFRDKAYLLEKPSIDRKDNNESYTFKNCRFIEFIENCRKGVKSL